MSLTVLIMIATCAVSIAGFRDDSLRRRLLFEPAAVLRRGERHRLLSSALVHADWRHLLFNMFSFWAFGSALEERDGTGFLGAVYLAGVLGGGLISLALHRNHDYRALGASGGVCGVIFATIFAVPGGRVVLFPLPIPLPAWLYAIGFLLASYYGLRVRADNIGHDAHLGGAVVGLLVATALRPRLAAESPLLFAVVIAIALALVWVTYRYPLATSLPKITFVTGDAQRRPQRRGPKPPPPPAPTDLEEVELDVLLDKVSRVGLEGLSERDRQRLIDLAARRNQH